MINIIWQTQHYLVYFQRGITRFLTPRKKDLNFAEVHTDVGK